MIVDGGAGIFNSPRRELFLTQTLQPTTHRLAGVDGVPHQADAEGLAQLHTLDTTNKTIWRITVPGILTETTMPGGYTLMSLPQLRNTEGIGHVGPSSVDDTPFMYTGNIHNPSRVVPLQVDDDGLFYIEPLTPKQLDHYKKQGFTVQDITSPPSAVQQGKTRLSPILAVTRNLVLTADGRIEGRAQTADLNLQDTPKPRQQRPKSWANGRRLRRAAARLPRP